MNLSKGIRQFHRWTSMAFVATVLANFAFMTQGQPPALVTYSPLLPLLLLTVTGIYMFVLPYMNKGRNKSSVNAA